jgi:hypothetical protein
MFSLLMDNNGTFIKQDLHPDILLVIIEGDQTYERLKEKVSYRLCQLSAQGEKCNICKTCCTGAQSYHSKLSVKMLFKGKFLLEFFPIYRQIVWSSITLS